jgi:kynurenine formamidase
VGLGEFEVDLSQPLDLSRPVGFGSHPGDVRQPFGAPAPAAIALQVGAFVGEVGRGGSCNCQTISLTPHASGTHTEGVGHLTREPLDAWRLLPAALLPCALVQLWPSDLGQGGREAITAGGLEAAWPRELAFSPVAAVIGSHRDVAPVDQRVPPFLTPDALRWLVLRGIEHVVVDLPSLDPVVDGGALEAHRVFFGLPARSSALSEARRPRATVTELAHVSSELRAGSYLLSLQAAAIDGDAVPSRPLLYAVRPAAA